MRAGAGRDGTRIAAAFALSLGAVAAPVVGLQPETADRGEQASMAVHDRLGEIRAQFETAFTPGVVEGNGAGGRLHPLSMIHDRRTVDRSAAVSGEGGPGAIIE